MAARHPSVPNRIVVTGGRALGFGARSPIMVAAASSGRDRGLELPPRRKARVRRVGAIGPGPDGRPEVLPQRGMLIRDPRERRPDRPRDADPGALGGRARLPVATTQ